jgi:hypothetical protein
MSNFKQMTNHPITGNLEFATWMDDYFGRHRYGVKFPSDGKVYEIAKFEKVEETKKFRTIKPEDWEKLNPSEKINYCKLHIKKRRTLSSTQARWLVEELESKNAQTA